MGRVNPLKGHHSSKTPTLLVGPWVEWGVGIEIIVMQHAMSKIIAPREREIAFLKNPQKGWVNGNMQVGRGSSNRELWILIICVSLPNETKKSQKQRNTILWRLVSEIRYGKSNIIPMHFANLCICQKCADNDALWTWHIFIITCLQILHKPECVFSTRFSSSPGSSRIQMLSAKFFEKAADFKDGFHHCSLR